MVRTADIPTREDDTLPEGLMNGRAPATVRELETLRDEIGRIDRDLVALIARRVMVARTIGETKRSAGLPTLDPAREAQLVRAVGGLAREAGLEADDLREIFWHLIALARRAQVEER